MEREADLRTFARWHVRSGDIDPVYPVLNDIGHQLCGTEDERISLTFLYVAYYDLASAITTWMEGWRPGQELSWQQMKRPTGTERRAHRDPKQFAPHIFDLGRFHKELRTWNALFPLGWGALQWSLMSMTGNGRWAAYKTGEMLGVLHGFPVEPTDAGHANSSGPRKGLADIYPETAGFVNNAPGTIHYLDQRTTELAAALGESIAHTETILCDWHSMLKRNYYVGHDIDLMLEQAHRPAVPEATTDLILKARQRAFDQRWRGEDNDWAGVRKPLKHLYVDEGVVEWWR